MVLYSQSVPAWTNEMFVRTLGGKKTISSHTYHNLLSVTQTKQKQQKGRRGNKTYGIFSLCRTHTGSRRLTQTPSALYMKALRSVFQWSHCLQLPLHHGASYVNDIFSQSSSIPSILPRYLWKWHSNTPSKNQNSHSFGCCHGLQLFCVGLEGFSDSGGALFYFLKWFGLQWLKHKHTDTHRKASSSGEILMRRDLLLINCCLTSPSLNSVAKYSCISLSIVLTNRMSLFSCGVFTLSTKASM